MGKPSQVTLMILCSACAPDYSGAWIGTCAMPGYKPEDEQDVDGHSVDLVLDIEATPWGDLSGSAEVSTWPAELTGTGSDNEVHIYLADPQNPVDYVCRLSGTLSEGESDAAADFITGNCHFDSQPGAQDDGTFTVQRAGE